MSVIKDFQFKPCKDCKKKGNSTFSCFFLHANEEQQRKVLEKAARQANEDQLKLLKKHSK